MRDHASGLDAAGGPRSPPSSTSAPAGRNQLTPERGEAVAELAPRPAGGPSDAGGLDAAAPPGTAGGPSPPPHVGSA
eukprot:4697318-Alexandrium_andersonii.AAC.1